MGGPAPEKAQKQHGKTHTPVMVKEMMPEKNRISHSFPPLPDVKKKKKILNFRVLVQLSVGHLTQP